MSVETFDADWLALREDVDHRSRAAGLLPRLTEWWEAKRCSTVLDLGCGTGSNLRYLAPKLPTPQEWTLVDHDAELLARIETPGGAVVVNPLRGDLADVGLAQVGRSHLVTASALLDLTSEAWLHTLADACAEAGCGALFALTYDGAIEWSAGKAGARGAADPVDALVRDAVNEHQRRDKGLGPALGPEAGRAAEEAFRARGYRTWLLRSPWVLGPDAAELVMALVSGWANAASEARPPAAKLISGWAERRRRVVAGGDFRLAVGHLDLLALPADRSLEPS